MKRNIFLSVFLPLFLCAAILTLGYSPHAIQPRDAEL